MTTYPYVPAWFDGLGPRKGPTLGLMYHMAEGGGTVGYLDKHGNPPARGVSVHAVCEYSGRVVQMLPWADASGSLNPRDRSSDKAYFGHRHLEAVLGDWWRDPNSAVLSMEIEGFAARGPNANQVAGATAWGRDMKALYPSLRGALGHADQTDTKRCPGTSGAMQDVFAGVGGHGLWMLQEADLVDLAPLTYRRAVDPKGSKAIRSSAGGPVIYTTKEGDGFALVGTVPGYHVLRMPGNIAGYLGDADVFREYDTPAPPAADCSAVEHELALANGRIHQAVTALGGTIV